MPRSEEEEGFFTYEYHWLKMSNFLNTYGSSDEEETEPSRPTEKKISKPPESNAGKAPPARDVRDDNAALLERMMTALESISESLREISATLKDTRARSPFSHYNFDKEESERPDLSKAFDDQLLSELKAENDDVGEISEEYDGDDLED
jgi:hypothetical protein